MALAITENRTHFKWWQVVLAVALLVCMVFTFSLQAYAMSMVTFTVLGLLALASIAVTCGVVATVQTADTLKPTYNSLSPGSQQTLNNIGTLLPDPAAAAAASVVIPAAWYKSIANDLNNVMSRQYSSQNGKYFLGSSMELITTSLALTTFSQAASIGIYKIPGTFTTQWVTVPFFNFTFGMRTDSSYSWSEYKVSNGNSIQSYYTYQYYNTSTVPYVLQSYDSARNLTYYELVSGASQNGNTFSVCPFPANSHTLYYKGTSYSLSLQNGSIICSNSSFNDSTRYWHSIAEYLYHTFVLTDTWYAYSLGLHKDNPTYDIAPATVKGHSIPVAGTVTGTYTGAVAETYTGDVTLNVGATIAETCQKSPAAVIDVPAEAVYTATQNNQSSSGSTSSGTSPIFIPPPGLGESAASALGQLTSGYNDFNSQFQDGISGFVSPIITNTPAPIKTILVSAITVFMIAGLMVLVI